MHSCLLKSGCVSGNTWMWLSYFLHARMACVWVHKCKGLHIKPPDLGVGRGLPMVVYGDRASHVVQRVGASAQSRKIKKCSLVCIISVRAAATHPSYSSVHTECLDTG